MQFEADYSSYILEFAKIASEYNVELFCIGTELKNSIEKRPDYWRKLIKEIQKTYSGKLTYAANWDEYKHIDFWKELDYIGVDAYFPLCNSNCSETEIKREWTNISKELSKYSNKFKKPILFTEFGYPSANYALSEPWRSDKSIADSTQQLLAYKSFFASAWNENWLAGIFVWKWYAAPEQHRISEHDFTPQNKPAINVLKDAFKP